jgi:2,3-bisphosphoglycerate-dependent phosphoglycerate mutase
MKLFCLRHGETVFNVEGRIQGQTDSRLTPLGHRQFQVVAETLSGFQFDAVIASPLSRAVESARYVADALGLNVQVDARLTEIHAGIFQGLRWDEIDQKYPDEFARWRSQDPDYRIPQGESRRDLMLRTAQAFCAIREAGYRQAIIVAHGGSLSGAFKALLGIPANRNPFTFANGSLSVAQWEKDFKLLSLNQTAHLGDAASNGGDL